MKTSVQVYDEFVAIINQAAIDRNIYRVPEAAERMGLSGGETQRGLSQRWEYSYVDAAGANLKVACRWYDQSKAFSIQPDMHIMTVTLEADEDRRSHERRYEE